MIALNIHPVLFFPAAIYSFIYVFYLSLYLAGGKGNNNIRSKRIKNSSFSLKIVCLAVAKMNLRKKKEKVVDDWAVRASTAALWNNRPWSSRLQGGSNYISWLKNEDVMCEKKESNWASVSLN